MKNIRLILVLFIFSSSVKAKISLPKFFSDNMVLQRNIQIPIWGWATPNEKIVVKFHNQTKQTTADSKGNWLIKLNDENAGGPFQLQVTGENTIQINNILVGEVWICSGQSNMEWTVGQSDNAKNEIAQANFPAIRHIKIPKEINSITNNDTKSAPWAICSPETVADFTGVGYFFAKQLYEKLRVPIGLINASWGGTNIETWISREGFESNDEFKEMISQMPKINLNELLDLKISATKTRIEKIQKSKIEPEQSARYKDFDLDDTNWWTLKQPGDWDEQGLQNFDGVAWLRKHFILTKADMTALGLALNSFPDKKITADGVLEIPAIDDNDITYINGVKIGETIGWDKKRVYQIPANTLKEGDNVIAIQVTDNGGGAGIYGKNEDLKLTVAGTQKNISGTWKLQVESIKRNINENDFPSLCYNAMIHPLIPFAFKGVIWYQGESNAARAFQYQKAFPLLINDWRKKWNTDFPFYFVQLATFTTKGDSNTGCSWAELREAQTKTLSTPHTGMVVTTDIGNPNDIHPTNKQDVGKRLANLALSNDYEGDKTIISKSPQYQSMKIDGNQMIVTFENTSWLKVKGEKLTGFEIAGDDHIFYPATAIVKNNQVIVSHPTITNPKAVRFGWIGDTSKCNLFNIGGLPASPFRTDNWNSITTDAKYKINP